MKKVRWRVPAALSAVIVLAQLAPLTPLADLLTGDVPTGVHLAWPITHVLFAPLTLLADWLNGGSRAELLNFGLWLAVGYAVTRVWHYGQVAPGHGWRRETFISSLFVLCSLLFVWWGARFNRPIPRLVADDSTLVIFDVHSHTAASHDGRPGFGAPANARWHARAGFDAAFITDHNEVGAAKQWRLDGGGRPPRLLDGEELSLSGLHVVALGTAGRIDPAPWAASFDSTLRLLDSLTSGHAPSGFRPYLIASLPEYWQHHWGEDLGHLVGAGVRGFEVLTTSPRAMEFPETARRTLIARSKAEHLALFGATDMHGIGNTACVWNVVRLPGWRVMDAAALTHALLAEFAAAPAGIQVVALRRAFPEGRLARAFAAPLGLLTQLRAAGPAHAAMLLVWLWGVALLREWRTRRRAAR